MIRRFTAVTATLLAALVATAMNPLGAQDDLRFASPADARAALDTARQQQREARSRREQLERRAAQSTEAAERALQEAAALAARVQQAEAAIAAAEARYVLATAGRRELDRELASRREPLVRLTAALQSLARRPLTLSAFQPGTLRELVYTRAVIDSSIPLVRRRTKTLRDDLNAARQLETEAREALADREKSENEMARRRRQLVVLAQRKRVAAKRATGGADREERRALLLAEEARDLDTLVGRLEQAGSLRAELAALPGPVLRPVDPGRAKVSVQPASTSNVTTPPRSYQLPVTGRLAYGFGAAGEGGVRQTGIGLIPRKSAQVVSPGAGRIAFAGPYRGFGDIVIIEHANGWTTLLTGLETLDASVGQDVTAGSPLGLAGSDSPQITVELRRDGEPVNPLDYLK